MGLFRSGLKKLKVKDEDIDEVEEILREFWEVGESRPREYRMRLSAILGLPSKIDTAEELFCKEFADYDILTNRPRLLTDSLWATVKKAVDEMEETGNCFMCGGRLLYHMGVSVCSNDRCRRHYHLKPIHWSEPKPEEILEKTESASSFLERRWKNDWVAG